MPLVHPFEPIYDEDSRVLVLGSFPSVKSRETHFYYGHPQNRFWRVTAHILGCPVPDTVEEKRAMLLAHGVAVWDALASCEITGSADQTIRNPVPNNISSLLERSKIELICFNGKKAHEVFTRYAEKPAKIPIQVLPSTSPANAQCSFLRLCEAWSAAFSKVFG